LDTTASSAQQQANASTRSAGPKADQPAAPPDQSASLNILGTDQGDDWSAYFAAEAETDQPSPETEATDDLVELDLSDADSAAFPEEVNLEDLYPVQPSTESDDPFVEDEADTDSGASLMSEWDTAFRDGSESASDLGDAID
jgi:hypothetical protein